MLARVRKLVGALRSSLSNLAWMGQRTNQGNALLERITVSLEAINLQQAQLLQGSANQQDLTQQTNALLAELIDEIRNISLLAPAAASDGAHPVTVSNASKAIEALLTLASDVRAMRGSQAEGMDGLTSLVDGKLRELVVASDHQQKQAASQIELLIALLHAENRAEQVAETAPPAAPDTPSADLTGAAPAFADVDVSNRSSRIVPGRLGTAHPGLRAIRALDDGQTLDSGAWRHALALAKAEMLSAPYADELLRNLDAAQTYIDRLKDRFGSSYRLAGFDIETALFLYWLVRQVQPKRIVQTGAGNGLSSALILHALSQNGGDGFLHVADNAAIFEPADAAWTSPGAGRVPLIPEGRSSAWLIPAGLSERYSLHTGGCALSDALETSSEIDFFIHTRGNRTAADLAAEVDAVYPKLARSWAVLAEGPGDNAALWKFADDQNVIGYEFAGKAGAIFR